MKIFRMLFAVMIGLGLTSAPTVFATQDKEDMTAKKVTDKDVIKMDKDVVKEDKDMMKMDKDMMKEDKDRVKKDMMKEDK